MKNRIKTVWLNFYQYKDLLRILVIRDIKVKYRRSVLGYLWSILNPLLTMIVMWLVFSNLFRFDIPNFPIYLLCGQIMFGFMSESTNMAMSSITGNAALLKKAYVPKYIFPVARVTSSLVNLLFSLTALILVLVITNAGFSYRMLMFWSPIIQLYFFCVGLGLFLAQATVFFRDLQYIWSVLLTAWTYLTPIFYPINIMPEWLQNGIKMFNPMYVYIAQLRDMVWQNVPSGPIIIYVGIAWSILMMAIGLWSFYRNQDKFILYV